VPKSSPPPLSFPDMGASPRQQIVHDAAASAIKEEGTLGSQAMSKPSYQHFRQPMPLLMQIFHDLSDKNEDFWFRIAPFFAKETIPAGTVLWNQGVNQFFVQSNIRMSQRHCICLRVEFFEHLTI
jgi:sulfate permease, SulP family